MKAIDSKLLEGIAFFEKMRQSMALDRASLEFLAVAYEQTGDEAKRHTTLIELAECLLQEGDFENAQIIAARLSATSSDAAAHALVERVAAAIQSPVGADARRHDIGERGRSPAVVDPVSRQEQVAESEPWTKEPDGGSGAAAIIASAASSEIALVWQWIDNGVIAKDIGMDVLHILTEQQMSGVPVLMSALAVLDELHPELTDDLLANMQQESQLPILPLDLLEPLPAALRQLPSEYCRIKGVVPWMQMGDELLCVILNPFSTALLDEVRQLTGRTCHFALAYPKVVASVLI